MKKIFKVLTAIFALGLVILVGLHLFLQYGLTKTMREVVLPRVKAEMGIDARVGRLSLNVAGGVLHLEEVVVRNPDGFLLENLASIDRINIAVDVASLFIKDPIRVENVEVENVLVNVIRNKDGEINLQQLKQALPPSQAAPTQAEPAAQPAPAEKPAAEAPPKPLPEWWVQTLLCNATLRYIDFKIEEIDLALELSVNASGLSNSAGSQWGEVAVIGALGSEKTSFVTDLDLRLAPLTEPAAPSFDLTGKVMEIDPRILEKVYDKAGIRSAPFGLEPKLYCRAGTFQESTIGLEIPGIMFEEKLAKQLGGVSTIGSLRFSVPLEGPLNRPTADVQGALLGALGGNVASVLSSALKGLAGEAAGLDEAPATLGDAAVEALAKEVEEIGESETLKKVLKDLADGKSSDTNAPSSVSSDTLIDILGEHVDEIGEDEELKKELKNLGKFLFGK